VIKVPFCLVADVKAAIDYPSSGAPISDTNILSFIFDAEQEIEDIYKTRFGSLEQSGTATSGTTTTLVDSGATFVTETIPGSETPPSPEFYSGYILEITSGTNSGEFREIILPITDTSLTVSQTFTSAIDATSVYEVRKFGYKDVDVDGSGIDTQFLRFQPLINLNNVTVNGTVVTISKIFQYKESGRLLLGDDAEVSIFETEDPQDINFRYIFGTALTRTIKRLCVLMAGIKTLVSQVAGTYEDFSTVSMPGGVSASKGQPYVNIQSAVTSLQKEANEIITKIKRPYMIFG